MIVEEKMKTVEEYYENTDRHNRMIQKALRETNMADVIDLCAYLGDKSSLILRNMSERAAAELQLTLDAEKVKIPEHAMRRAYAGFQKKLLKYEDKMEKISFPDDGQKLDFSTAGSIRQSLLLIHKLNVQGKVGELNVLAEEVEDKRLRKMIKLVLHGCDPVKADVLMEKQVNALVEEFRGKVEMVKQGLEAILSEDSLEDLIDIIDD